MKTTEELQKELDALIAEEVECRKIIEQAKKCEKRLESLNQHRGNPGNIEIKKQEIEDSKYPVWHESGRNIERIVDVTEKWISIKPDGLNKPITRYKKDNGWRERSRDGYWKIDVQKALEIWEEWQIVEYQYYWKNDNCIAKNGYDKECICWNDEGTGPMPNEMHDSSKSLVQWRIKQNKC
jgi:hypothetical protein